MPRVKLHWVPDSEIKETEAKLAKRFDSTKTLKGTRGYHNFVPVDKKKHESEAVQILSLRGNQENFQILVQFVFSIDLN